MHEECKDLKPKPSNPATALSAFKRIKPAAVQAIQDIKQPGIQADIAISTFINELKAVLNSPADYTIASILTEALTTGSKIAESTTQNLLRLSVKCGSPDEIYLQAEKIRNTGRYDRSLAALADVTQDPAYDTFNPEHDQGKHLWTAILELLLAYWKRPKSAQADQRALETEYKHLSCLDPATASEFLTTEAELYTKLQSAHIIYSDQQRIRALLNSCSKQIKAAYHAFRKRKKEDNHWDHLHDTDVNLFAQDLETVTDAMDPADKHVSEPETPTQKPRKPRRTEPSTSEHSDTQRERPCWDHQYIADGCDRGDQCPWEHIGEPGDKKLKYATEDGACRAFLVGTCDRGAQCKFTHPPKKPAGQPYEPECHHVRMDAEELCQDDKDGHCTRGDQCPKWHVKPRAKTPPREPAPDTDGSDDDDSLYY